MNVFVIVADSWRHDHFGLYGADGIKTPNLDALAKESMVFDNSFSGGLPTLPQRTECLTGRYTLGFRSWQHIETGDELLAEALWNQGMESALITDTYHMHKPQMAFERGFDTVRFIRGQEFDPFIVDKSIAADALAHLRLRDASDPSANRNENIRAQMEQYERNRAGWKTEEDHFAARVFKEGIDWIEKRKGRDNLFLWLDSFDPHETWDPMPPYNRMYQPNFTGKDMWQWVPGQVEGYMNEDDLNHLHANYAGMCTMVDKWIGVFLNRARELGFLENTLILFTSDHGEPLGDGKWGHGAIRKCRHWPYEELVHTPLIVRHPAGLGAGRRSAAYAQPCDYAPTILDFLGREGLPKRHGFSLLPVVRGDKEKVRDFAVTGWQNHSWSIREGDWSYVLWLGGKMGGRPTEAGYYKKPSPPELYNRSVDKYELNDVIAAHPDVALRLDQKLREFMANLA